MSAWGLQVQYLLPSGILFGKSGQDAHDKSDNFGAFTTIFGQIILNLLGQGQQSWQ